MAITRRKFLSETGALAGLSLAGSSVLAAADGASVRQRKDVTTLASSSPDIEALKIAVAKMKRGDGLGPNDPRRWQAQTEIHGKLLGSFTNCQHGSWYFLPWHRGYLYFFEEIIRELSGNEEFALPYWDWTKDRTLPELFWGDGNPLGNPRRPDSPRSGRGMGLTPNTSIPDEDYDRLLSKKAIAEILAINDFETFAGLAVDRLGQSSGEGRLQNAPHNYIHNFVGGDMASGGSAFDPIFWLHHCNVDRLWVEWAARHAMSTPADKGWLETPIKHFCNRKGEPTTILVKETLNTGDLKYVYDRRPMVLVTNAQARPRLEFAPLAFHGDVANGASSFHSVANADFVSALSDKTREPELESSQTIRLRISGIEPPEDPDTVLDIFLNCEKLSPDTAISDPSYIGSCTFFLHGEHNLHGEHKRDHDQHGLTFVFDLSREFARLYGDRPLAKDEPLKVSVLTRPLTLNKNRPTPSIGKLQELNPQQVYIEVVRA